MDDPDDRRSADESSDGELPEDEESPAGDESSEGNEAGDDNRKAERWHRALQLATEAVTLGSALLALYAAWRHGTG
jgi:hypothetical protein